MFFLLNFFPWKIEHGVEQVIIKQNYVGCRLSPFIYEKINTQTKLKGTVIEKQKKTLEFFETSR